MSTQDIAWRRQAGSLLHNADDRWSSASPASRTRIQVAVLLAATVIAFHYSLSTLMQNLGLDTPLAYVGLVPAIALALAAALRHPRPNEPPIHDRQLDFIVGLPLVIGSVVAAAVVPEHIGDLYWVWRLDLLILPFFVAGAIALLFGTRTLWRQKLTIAYLLLSWPFPYTEVLINVLNGFTSTTIGATKLALHVIKVARPVPGGDGSLFVVTHHATNFELSVVSACSGVNGVVGFMLVGLAFAAIVQGPRLRKTLWLIGGMSLLWATNVIRLLIVFWAGKQYGENFAINVLHPIIGLIIFSVGVLVMAMVAPKVGLSIGGSPSPRPAPTGGPTISRITPALAILAVAAVVLGVLNADLRQYDLVAGAAGDAKLASFTQFPAAPSGWTANFETLYTWAKPYFGANSTWYRFIYDQTTAAATLGSNVPVTADVINTTNLSSFSAFGVPACYQFHGYTLRDQSDVTFAGGIRGQALSYTTSHHGDWSLVYWIMPVKSSGATHYERIILYLQDSQNTIVRFPKVAGLASQVRGSLNTTNPSDAALLSQREFLVDFARNVIVAQQKVQPGSQLPGLQLDVANMSSDQSSYLSSQSRTASQDGTIATGPARTLQQDRDRAKSLGYKLNVRPSSARPPAK
jgi:exosortase